MSLTTRALAVPTGHPILKLVLLAVAAAPGWPAAADVAELAELDPGWTRDALAELVRRGHLNAHTGTDATRYGLPEDGWTYTRADTEAPEDAPAAAVQAALDAGDIGGYPMAAPVRLAHGWARKA